MSADSLRIDQQPLIIVDCQTTSGSAATGEILELAWKVLGPCAIERQFVIQHESISPRVLSLTGLSPVEVAAGAPLQSVIAELAADLAKLPQSIFVAHFAHFERRFIEQAFARHLGQVLNARWICTHRLSFSLYPHLPSRSLRAVAGYLGYPIEGLKRAATHVDATFHIWNHAVQELKVRGIDQLANVESLQSTKSPTSNPLLGQRNLVDPKLRLTLPRGPGVYCFYGAGDRLLYVGKATNLKDRVNSYFRGRTGKRSKQQEMITQIKDIKVQATATAIEAAMLENDFIKSLHPPYNMALRAREHQPLWYSSVSTTAGARDHTAVPLAHQRTVDDLEFLLSLLEASPADLNEVDLFSIEDLDVLRSGVSLFREQLAENNHVHRPSRRNLMAVGAILLRKKLKEDTLTATSAELESEESEQEVVEDTVFQWTPELIAKRCFGMLRTHAWHRHRGLYIRSLINADVYIKYPARGWRLLVLRNGALQNAISIKRLMRSAYRCKSHNHVDFTQLDHQAFDRLRILATELRRHPHQVFVCHPAPG